MKKNAIATLTTAIKNMNAKNFTLNVQKQQKKIGTAKFAKNTYWGSWATIRGGMNIANADTNTMFQKFESEWLKLKNQFNQHDKDWFWRAYLISRFSTKNEPNASVRLTKNAALRVELAKKVLNKTLSKDVELCNKVRKSWIRRNKHLDSVYYM